MNWYPFLIWFLPSFIASAILLAQHREPSSTIVWLCLINFFPILGVFLFLVFGPQTLERAAGKRKRGIRKRVLSQFYVAPDEGPLGDSEESRVLALARRVSDYPATSGNEITILSDPEAALDEMNKAIESATEFIHLQYYIIENDEVTKQLFEGLERACTRGVEVRVLYDSFGSLFLKRRLFASLLKRGAKVAGFLPLSSILQRININFRNHRKILVIDGKIAFTGSANIGKNYLGKSRKNQWRDYVVRVRGPACLQLQDVFARDWLYTTKEDIFTEKYYPSPQSVSDSVVQVLESGPDTEFQSLHQALFMALNFAKEKVLIITPYFIPDPAITTALVVAALKGVDIRIVVPKRSDSRVVRAAGRSYYENLLRAGARIFEYQPRVIHSKLMVIDGTWTVLGSFNMDIRSFKLNFELNLFIHSPDVARQGTEIFNQDIDESNELTLAEHINRPVGVRMAENACRLLSPLL